MKHAMIIVTALAVLSGAAQLAAAADGKAVYDKSCGSCHNKGLMGAPKLGDKDKWAPLIKNGQAALDDAVMKGKGKMKPKGGNDALTADDIKAANEYIAKQAQ
jgi:cytochrome c5